MSKEGNLDPIRQSSCEENLEPKIDEIVKGVQECEFTSTTGSSMVPMNTPPSAMDQDAITSGEALEA